MEIARIETERRNTYFSRSRFFLPRSVFPAFLEGWGGGGGGVSMGRDTRLNGRYWMPSFKILQLQRGEGFFSSVNLNMYVCK